MKKILIIEDDDFIEEMEAKKILANGFKVVSAQNGVDAIKKIMEPGLNLILLDITLPNFNGFDILKKIKETESTKKIPVIIYSNMATEENIKKAKEMGADKFMVKSGFSLSELMEEINKLI